MQASPRPAQSAYIVGGRTGSEAAERREVLDSVREALRAMRPSRLTLEACSYLLAHLAGSGEAEAGYDSGCSNWSSRRARR